MPLSQYRQYDCGYGFYGGTRTKDASYLLRFGASIYIAGSMFHGSMHFTSDSIFIALNLHLKTDSRHTKQKKQKTIIINLRHSKGQCHREKPGKAEVSLDILVQRDRF